MGLSPQGSRSDQNPVKRHLVGLVKNPGIGMVRDLAMLSLGQVGAQVLGFATFAWLARALGPAGYGTLEYVMALAAFTAAFVDFGLGAIAVRAHAQEPGALARFAAILPVLRLLIGLLTVPAMIVFVFLAAPEGPDGDTARKLVLFFGLAVLMQAWRQEWLLQATERMDRAALAQMLKTGSFAALVFLLVGGPEDLILVGAIEVASVAIWIGFYLSSQVRAGISLRLSAPLADLGRLLREAAPLGANAVLWGVTLYLPLILLGSLAGVEQAAWFAAAQRLVAALLAFTYLYHFNLYPAMTRRFAEGPAALVQVSGASMRVLAWAMFIPAMLTSVYAADLTALLFGAPFAASGPALAILIWSVPVHFLSGHARWGLTAAGQNGAVLISALAGVAVFALAGPVLVGAFGSAGAAATVTAQVLAIWAGADFMARRHGIALPFVSIVALPLAASAVVGGVVSVVFPHSPLAGMPAGLVLGAALGLLLDRRLLTDLRHLAYAKRDHALK
jgi:O-antigen/teichoic acid export membrane protein